MALQGYADQPCPQWDSNPPLQYMSWPSITPVSRRLNLLGHHDKDKCVSPLIILIIIMNLYSAGSISQNAHRQCNVCVVTFYSI